MDEIYTIGRTMNLIPIILFGLIYISIVLFIDINDKEEIWFKKSERLLIYLISLPFGCIITLIMDILVW